MHVIAHIEVRRQLLGCFPFFYHAVPWDRTQIVRFGGKNLCLLSRLAGPLMKNTSARNFHLLSLLPHCPVLSSVFFRPAFPGGGAHVWPVDFTREFTADFAG